MRVPRGEDRVSFEYVRFLIVEKFSFLFVLAWCLFFPLLEGRGGGGCARIFVELHGLKKKFFIHKSDAWFLKMVMDYLYELGKVCGET